MSIQLLLRQMAARAVVRIRTRRVSALLTIGIRAGKLAC
jgi:hypothetical protein